MGCGGWLVKGEARVKGETLFWFVFLKYLFI